MSLIKLFNFKYLLQNIKKSKMAIVLFLTVVPLFTSLYLIISADSTYYKPMYMEFSNLAIINIFFMYIVPFILSVSLFGYVYKKNSVDFIGSMPISRSSIFLTNTIGGILLIVLTQFITLICTFILKALIVDSVVIFSGLILDVFVFQTIAYIFVFAISNLAMSLSGNVITQIAVTLLIMFLVPFSHSVFTDFSTSQVADLVSGEERLTVIYDGQSNIYTAPSMVFTMGYEYNVYSMLKMGALAIVYIALGAYIFNKRKMEVAGTSFENKWIHLGIKTLTLSPFAALLVILVNSSEYEVILMLLAIMLVYYFIYDLVTNKKIKVSLSLATFCISVIALFGIYKAGMEIYADLPVKEMDVNKIDYIEIVSIGGERFLDNINLVVDDEEIMDKIYYAISGAATYYMNQSAAMEIFDDNKINVSLKIKMHFDNNKDYYVVTYFELEEFREILAMLDNSKIQDISDFEIGLYNSNTVLSEEQKDAIKQSLNSTLITYTPLKYFELNNSSELMIQAVKYDNHKLMERFIPLAIDKDIEKLVVSIYNTDMYKLVNTKQNVYLYLSNYDRQIVSSYFEDYEEMYSIIDTGFYGYETDFKKFIEENYDKEIDFEKTYFVIRGGNNNRFYTNNVEEIINLLKERNKEYKDTIDEEIYYEEVYYD